jgi:hypothetical protein
MAWSNGPNGAEAVLMLLALPELLLETSAGLFGTDR